MRRRLRLLRPAGPVKVFGIGLPKTGTKTLGECFERLGFKHRSYDMELAAQVKRGGLENVLIEAAKYETFEDWPWFLIYRELDRRFPGSKFILTLRKDVDAYLAGLRKHHDRREVLEYFQDRPDDLLVVCWKTGDGWGELCRFLNKRRPDRPFPHENRAPRYGIRTT